MTHLNGLKEEQINEYGEEENVFEKTNFLFKKMNDNKFKSKNHHLEFLNIYDKFIDRLITEDLNLTIDDIRKQIIQTNDVINNLVLESLVEKDVYERISLLNKSKSYIFNVIKNTAKYRNIDSYSL